MGDIRGLSKWMTEPVLGEISKSQLFKRYKKQEDMEHHGRFHPEGTQHIKGVIQESIKTEKYSVRRILGKRNISIYTVKYFVLKRYSVPFFPYSISGIFRFRHKN